MGSVLYVTNFPPETTADELAELFNQAGTVETVDIAIEEKTETPFAIIAMAAEKHATKANREFNGHALGEYRLAVSYPEVDPRDLTAKQRKAMDAVIETLEETDDVPLRQIEAMVRLCGTFFVEALVEEALAIDEREGLMTSDGERRRSKGGVFFYLARYRISPDVRRVIFNRKGKMPAGVES
ncbi:MAG: hypothetical protein JXA10_06250 [Anaerolineae bacterium]|nr:hypothetical protein [Anaerolineae bacterium]